MYNAFFGFSESPFNLSPDPAFFYRSEQHEEALANLVYGVQARKGFIDRSWKSSGNSPAGDWFCQSSA